MFTRSEVTTWRCVSVVPATRMTSMRPLQIATQAAFTATDQHPHMKRTLWAPVLQCATRSFPNSSKNLLSDCRTSSGGILKYLDCIGDAVEKSSVNSAKHMNCVSSAKAIYRCGNTGDLRISVSNWCTLGCAIQELVTFALIDSNAFMTSAVVALCALFA